MRHIVEPRGRRRIDSDLWLLTEATLKPLPSIRSRSSASYRCADAQRIERRDRCEFGDERRRLRALRRSAPRAAPVKRPNLRAASHLVARRRRRRRTSSDPDARVGPLEGRRRNDQDRARSHARLRRMTASQELLPVDPVDDEVRVDPARTSPGGASCATTMTPALTLIPVSAIQ